MKELLFYDNASTAQVRKGVALHSQSKSSMGNILCLHEEYKGQNLGRAYPWTC